MKPLITLVAAGLVVSLAGCGGSFVPAVVSQHDAAAAARVSVPAAASSPAAHRTTESISPHPTGKAPEDPAPTPTPNEKY